MKIVMWTDQEESEYMVQSRSQCVPGKYVRAVGSMRKDPNTEERMVNCFNLRPITDFNEITYHLLDSIHAHLYNTQGPKGSAPPAGNSNFASPGKPSMGPGGGAAGGVVTGAGAAVATYSAPVGGAGKGQCTRVCHFLSLYAQWRVDIENSECRLLFWASSTLLTAHPRCCFYWWQAREKASLTW